MFVLLQLSNIFAPSPPIIGMNFEGGVWTAYIGRYFVYNYWKKNGREKEQEIGKNLKYILLHIM